MYTYDLVCGDSKLFSVFCDCPKYAFDNLFSNAGELVMVQLMLSSQFLFFLQKRTVQKAVKKCRKI